MLLGKTQAVHVATLDVDTLLPRREKLSSHGVVDFITHDLSTRELMISPTTGNHIDARPSSASLATSRSSQRCWLTISCQRKYTSNHTWIFNWISLSYRTLICFQSYLLKKKLTLSVSPSALSRHRRLFLWPSRVRIFKGRRKLSSQPAPANNGARILPAATCSSLSSVASGAFHDRISAPASQLFGVVSNSLFTRGQWQGNKPQPNREFFLEIYLLNERWICVKGQVILHSFEI